MSRSNRQLIMALVAISCFSLTTGCTATALGAVATIGATAIQDPRSIGTQIDDTNAVARISLRLSDIEGLSESSDIE
ncbi:MAG TPA: osmotically-inducible protein OsmY, partial [Glaciecola sp.]|nr:osmotically-inducible protein OsmY [Glaciecola sp.]